MSRIRLVILAVVVSVLAVPVVGNATRVLLPPKPVTIKVNAGEYYFKLGLPKTVKPGTKVTFIVTNKGTEVHDFDFNVLGKKTTYLAPGKTATLVVTFRKKGNYTFICSVPRHAERGMAGAFIVK